MVMGEGPEAGKVKVADFGLARFFQVGPACIHVHGSYVVMAMIAMFTMVDMAFMAFVV